MKKLICLFIIVLITLAAFSTRNASAFILVSGDSNIADPSEIPGFGNNTFFSNILGAGTTVKVLDGVSGGDFDYIYDSFGVTVTSDLLASTTTITDAILSGVDLFIAVTPDLFITSETDAMSDFLAGGGDIFFVGEYGSFGLSDNGDINSALSALGSSMSLNTTSGPLPKWVHHSDRYRYNP